MEILIIASLSQVQKNRPLIFGVSLKWTLHSLKEQSWSTEDGSLELPLATFHDNKLQQRPYTVKWAGQDPVFYIHFGQLKIIELFEKN